jgi:sn-glycerol 3-phosphate transport system substrate-binding protein
VLFYNKTLFRKAGLDPDKPPQTLAEVKEYSDKIMQSGAAKHGLALRMAPFLNEFFYAKDGKLYADHDNGRKGRAQHVLFDTPMGRELWNWFRDMVKSGRALYTSSNEGDATHLLALGTGDAAMTFEGSGVLGPIVNVLESGQYAGTEVGVAPLPDLRPGGGVQTAEGSLWIVSRSAPEKQAAAWQYIKFLDSKAELVDLHLRTGYVPIRKSVAESPEIQALWKKSPEYAVSYEQLVAGPTNAATTGPVIGAFPEVREAVKDGYVSMFVGGKTAEQALKETQARADAAIKDYNDRVAG